MNILLNSEPISISENFFSSYTLLNSYLNLPIGKFIKKNNHRCLITERAFFQGENKSKQNIVIFDNEIKSCFYDESLSNVEIMEKFYTGLLNDTDKIKLKKLYNEKLNGFIPEVIVSIEFSNKILEEMFPEALHITHNTGIFRRPPFPNTINLDLCGGFKYDFLKKHKNELKNLQINNEDDFKIEKFKKNIKNILLTNNPHAEIIKKYKTKFDKLVLLPLQFSEHYAFDTESPRKNLSDLICHVMDNVPSNIGVIVTEHNFYNFISEGKFEKGGYLKWFENKYPNFIFIENFGNYNSAYLLPYIDGLINVASTVALLSLLFDLKIVSIGKSYNDHLKDSQGLDNISEILATEKTNKNNLIYWLLTHFYLFKDKQNVDYLDTYINTLLDNFKNNGINFEIYPKLYELDYILNFIEANLRENIINSIKKTTFLEKIFSLKNKGIYKVLRILGFKFEFRRKLK